MDINVNISGINEKNSRQNRSIDPRIIMDPNFESSIELTKNDIDSMVDEIDKYYNIGRDQKLKSLIRETMYLRVEFLKKYRELRSWYKNNR